MTSQSEADRPPTGARSAPTPASVRRRASASPAGRVRRQLHATLPGCWCVPGGHGHKYTTEQVDGWYAVMQPTGLTPADLDNLKQVIATED